MKTIIVLGATSDIGKAISEELTKDSFEVITLGRDKSNRLIWDIENYNTPPELPDQITIDGYVNVLGVNKNMQEECSDNYTRDAKVVKMNILSSLSFFYHVKKNLAKNCSIIHIGSLATKLIYKDDMAYLISKSAVYGLVKGIAAEVSILGGKSNMISPGYVQTRMTSKSWNDNIRKSARTSRTLRGLWATPEDVASATAFLMSEKSNYINGQNLFIDDGWSINSTL